MTQRTDYLIQILDKIGLPLMGAVASAPKDGDAEQSDSADAQAIASLLGKVAQVSIAMNDALDLNAADAQDDALRAALAGLAGPMVAAQYKQHGRTPSDADLKQLQASMQAVLTFADNFTPSDDHVKRLAEIEANGQAMDAHQVNIQYVHAFIPVINAVSAFSFGQPEQKLIMDISERLVNRAVEMREALMPNVDGDAQKLVELSILRSLSDLYAACYSSETKRLSAMDGDAAEASSLDPVWKSFDTRSAMLEAVARNVMPGGSSTPEAAPAPVAAPSAPAPPAEEKTEQAAPSVPQPPAPPAETSSAPSAPSGDGSNPMSFFGAPKGDEESGDGGQPAPPPAEEEKEEAPPAPPPPPAPEPPPMPEPPSEPPSQPPTTEDSKDGDGEESGGNPMSFFTKKKEEE